MGAALQLEKNSLFEYKSILMFDSSRTTEDLRRSDDGSV